ncbi:hypothetical protein A2U01_0050214, partial [Trifolium medium]|nr:hypothetical protein [Trifolium medium]
VVNALNDIEKAYRKDVKKKARENIQKMAESIERAGMKRLTLFSHEDMEQERLKRIEEKRLQEEEKKKQEEEEAQQENIAAHSSDLMDAETSEQVNLDKGKAIVSNSDPLVLKLQEELAAQKAEQELLKEEVKNLTESQHHVIKMQEDMNSKLDAILAFMSKKP